MSKEEELVAVRTRIEENSQLPLKKGATNLVFGEGDINTELMLIGEAPGFHEDRLGRPFVGNAGNLLNKLLLKAGLRRDQVYITNIIKYRPPENRDPEPAEIEAFVPYLLNQIEIINPKCIVTLGRFSMNFFLPKVKISDVHGRPFRVNGRILIPMFHPAAALRRGDVMTQLESDFERLPAILREPDQFIQQDDAKDDDENQMKLFG